MVKVIKFSDYFKRINLKRILCYALLVIFIFSTVCITVVDNSQYKPRLTAPLRSNRYYYGDNVFYNSGYGMPNCTAYAWGRAYEILGEKPVLSLSDAGNWYEYNKTNKIYDYGLTPMVGAIACFDNEYGGHVAVVEKIENGTITFSNSAYSGSNFYLTTASVDGKNYGQKGWEFQGFIYLLDDNESNVNALYSSYEVVPEVGINLRKSPDINSDVESVIPKGEQILVAEVVKSQNYTWGLVCYNNKIGYCALEYVKCTI